MIIIHVAVTAQENCLQDFERILREIVNEARQLESCKLYEWYRHPEVPQHYHIYAEFYTRQDFEAYLNSQLVKRIGTKLIPFLTIPPSFSHYEANFLEEG